jgi:hypothetical protein
MLVEFEVKKIKEIINDCQAYVDKKKHMPTSFNLSSREFEICQKARKEGIRLTVKYNGETRSIPLTKRYII